VVIHSQVKTRLSLYKDEEALLHTADRPVVWIPLLVSNAQNHEGTWVKTE
jgi:hypothetical protein